MIKLKNATILGALALGMMATASPALITSSAAQTGEFRISAARAEALRECNALANKFVQYTRGNTQGDQLRACMAQHGQPE
jgi:hypothetical protein